MDNDTQATTAATESQQTETTEETKQAEKTFTQAEVDKIVENRLQRERVSKEKMAAEIEAKLKHEQSEAQKLKDMSEQQRTAYENKRLTKELKALQAKVNRNEMEHVALDLLAEKNITANDDVLKFVVADTAEATRANIETFANVTSDLAKSYRRREFASNPAPKDTASKQNVDKAQFARMTYAERVALKQRDPQLYNNLISK